MLELIKIRKKQGFQAIKNIRKAKINEKFRGFPIIDDKKCPKDCFDYKNICPTEAISINPLTIDLGKCIFCGNCAKDAISFKNFHKTASTSRDYLIIDKNKNELNYEINAIKVRKEIRQIFGRSLKLRSVSAGGCSACEWELNACSNVNFDMGRFGIDIVASPRHADGIIITGPITENMATPLEDAYLATPNPKIIILAGTCAISGGLFIDSKAINREFLEKYKVDLYIPGCPIHPLTFITGVLDFLGR